MTRPRGPLDPETLARLQQILEPRRGAPAPAAPRPAPPPAARVDVAYVLTVASREARPLVEVRQRRVEPNERPGAWEDAKVTPKTVARVTSEADREILGALLSATATTASNQLALAEEEPSSRFLLSRAACARLLPLLGKSGRLWLRRADAKTPLAWQEQPWSLRLRVTEALPGGAEAPWDVHGVLCSGETEVPLPDVDAYLEGGYAISRGRLARVDDGGASSWLGMLLPHRSVRITPPRRASFLEELYSLPAAPPLDLPGSLALPEVTATATPRLRILAPGTDSGPLFADLAFGYVCPEDPPEAPPFVVPARRSGKVAFDAGRMRLVRRDAEAEARAAARLVEIGVSSLPRTSTTAPEGAHLSISATRLPAVVAGLCAERWHVEAEGRVHRSSSDFRMGIRSGVDWLDLEGTVAFGELAAPVSAVLEALRRGATTVVLGDGSLGVLPEAWLRQHGIVLRLGVAHEGRIRFSRSQAPLLAALAAAEPAVRADDDFGRIQAALAGAGDIVPEDPPPTFQGELRAYQRAGLAWLRRLARVGASGLLADEMGLGKTVQVLAQLAGSAVEAGRPSLVVAPRSLVFNWKREAARFTPSLRVLDHTGGDRAPPGPHFGEHDLILTTYGTLRRDAAALATIDFDYVILDEAQAIKNDASETARAARLLRGARRLALTGTPVENHLGELWSIMEFLSPGLLGRAAAWKAAADTAASPDAVDLLNRALRPMLLRRTKAEVAPDLPARMEETWVCELEGADRTLYDELRTRFRAELLGQGEGAGPARVLEALLRLRQAACHPGLLDPARRGGRGPKLDALIPELVALRENGQKALVFSQFRSLLDLARPHLEAEGLGVLQLDGTTRDREGVVARFQSDPSCSVLLISLKAGGVGLNLTAAEYVFLLDPWWNPAAEAQAIDRAHRLGQTRAVFAYRLIAKDTVEERIAELQQKKRLLAESVIRGDGAPLRDLSREDLDRLLS